MQVQDGWILAKFSFYIFMDLDFVHKNAKRELGQYPAILTLCLVNNMHLWILRNVPHTCWTIWQLFHMCICETITEIVHQVWGSFLKIHLSTTVQTFLSLNIHLITGISGIHLNQQDGIAQLLEHREENPRVVPARFLSD